MAWLGLHIVNHRTLSNRDVLACIELADELGYDGVTLNEDVGHDSFALLSVAATRTRRVLLGTAITNVYVRTALQVAMGAVTLDDLSGGRAQLGLSVGHHPWNDLYHG
ncbi:MAG: LLM class flavin-dependent oxidoreductase, partial [Mycobacterium sp.]|nr:LLM class flavin-dependent oxidoreductase [Mycobacterium sp.]